MNTEPTLYARAYEMAASEYDEIEIMLALGSDSMEVKEGILHGATHAFFVKIEKAVRAMPPQVAYGSMQTIGAIVSLAQTALGKIP